MPIRHDDDDWDDDFADEAEGVGDDDGDERYAGDEEEATIPCPHCGREIYDDAERCPHCEQYLSQEDAPAAGPSAWLVAGILLCLAIVLAWILLGW